MTEHTCGISYGEEEALHFGASYYPEDREDRETELYVIRRGKANREDSPNYEAEAAAEIVKDLIDRNYQVYDRTTGMLRGITFRDIVILMRAPSSGNLGETYAQSLKKRGIPAYYAEDGGFFANAEVNILLSFLKVIDNPLQDIHFVAMMRNVYGFRDSDLAEIRADQSAQRRGRGILLRDVSSLFRRSGASGTPESAYRACGSSAENLTAHPGVRACVDADAGKSFLRAS